VAIGASGGGYYYNGRIRVYDWNEAEAAWVQRGSDIDGEATQDQSGNAVSLSSDGTIVAIGALYDDGAGGDSGHVRVYEWSGSVWTQVGSDIDGEVANDESGKAVLLSSNGTAVAIGAPSNPNIWAYGHVRVYDLVDVTPTVQPSEAPTMAPSAAPTMAPSNTPVPFATPAPSIAPTGGPSFLPSIAPSMAPSVGDDDFYTDDAYADDDSSAVSTLKSASVWIAICAAVFTLYLR
jgi:hypothetical protein